MTWVLYILAFFGALFLASVGFVGWLFWISAEVLSIQERAEAEASAEFDRDTFSYQMDWFRCQEWAGFDLPRRNAVAVAEFDREFLREVGVKQ